MSEANWSNNPQADVVCAADEVIGLTRHREDDGSRTTTIRPGANCWGVDGVPVAGLLFVIADSVVGGSCIRVIGASDVIVTSSLHIEIHERPFAAEPSVLGVGGAAHRYHGGVAAPARLLSADRVIASASGRFAVLPLGTRSAGNINTATNGRPADAAPKASPPSLSVATVIDSPMAETLQSRLVESSTDGLTLSFVSRPQLANERQGLHGGVGAMMGERTCDALIRSIAPDGHEFRVVGMSASFFRPIPADGCTVSCTARIEHAGRQLIVARAVIRNAAGKPAVVVEVVAGGVPTG